MSSAQALASRYSNYQAHAGMNVAGMGFSATRFITEHWLINVDGAYDRLLGSAADSPITQRKSQRVFAGLHPPAFGLPAWWRRSEPSS